MVGDLRLFSEKSLPEDFWAILHSTGGHKRIFRQLDGTLKGVANDGGLEPVEYKDIFEIQFSGNWHTVNPKPEIAISESPEFVEAVTEIAKKSADEDGFIKVYAFYSGHSGDNPRSLFVLYRKAMYARSDLDKFEAIDLPDGFVKYFLEELKPGCDFYKNTIDKFNLWASGKYKNK